MLEERCMEYKECGRVKTLYSLKLNAAGVMPISLHKQLCFYLVAFALKVSAIARIARYDLVMV